MATYSFQNITCIFAGPGGIISLGADAAVAEEGITIERVADKNTMTIGAGGQGMHSLRATKAGTITVRLLKTSISNALLSAAYDLEVLSSAVWGQNVITINDTGRGDNTVAQQVAFKKHPNLTYATEGGMMEWAFDAIQVDTLLGTGQ